MNKLLQYDLFVFDFDGTIMDTEKIHCKSWNNVISNYLDKKIFITMDNYQKYFHSLTKNSAKNYLTIFYNIKEEDYDQLYKLKQNMYEELIQKEDINFIKGADIFLKYLIENKKKIIIVSNTSKKFIDYYTLKFPILKDIYKIYTKELFVNRKPNPECYLHIVNEYKDYKIIGFEDSLLGINSLYQVNDIVSVLIYDKDYYYNDLIIEKYNNIIVLENYNINDLENKLNNYNVLDNSLIINKILNNNINELQKNYKIMNNIINQISIIINNLNVDNHIYLSGMGKSGYVCKKSASTWQSLSIKCSYVDLPNLPHGDFGIFRDGDVLILISNSGNTDEIIYILKYLKYNLKKKITTISIVANKDSEMEKISTFTYILENIREADFINMTPSTSSLIFMALLDGIAINVRKNITEDEFKFNHPAGSLGKRKT
jgi:D-arabinose 5-phosphate isomerase GutQ/beta-phosphoglucomutase-like phosphatase (HAD superfamily)